MLTAIGIDEEDVAMFQHPDHLSLLAEERRASVARAAADRAALRAHRGAGPRWDLRAHVAGGRRLLGHRPRFARSGPAEAPLAGGTGRS